MKRIHPLDPALAAALAARRRALGWSQNRLALAARLTEGLVAKLETNRVPITPEHRAALEAALEAGEREWRQEGAHGATGRPTAPTGHRHPASPHATHRGD
jgi:transcriptional regulator with XRE-family HTH domain